MYTFLDNNLAFQSIGHSHVFHTFLQRIAIIFVPSVTFISSVGISSIQPASHEILNYI